MALTRDASEIGLVGGHEEVWGGRQTASVFPDSIAQSVAQETPFAETDALPPTSAPETPGVIMQFKVWLLGLSPMVWRRVLVPADFTLRQLHGVIQVAMGWGGIHLFQFQLRAIRYGSWEVAARSPSDSDGRPASFSIAWRRQTRAD